MRALCFQTQIARLLLSLTTLYLSLFMVPLVLPAGSAPPMADSVEAHIGRGYEYVQNTQFQHAAQEFRAVLAQNPALVRVRYQLGVCYFALQQYREAREEFERLRQETSEDPSVLYYLARLDLLDEDFDSAVAQLHKIASAPPFPDAVYYLGAAYLKKGGLEKAERWLKKAGELTSRDFRIPDRLARVYMKAGRRQEAEQQFALSASLRKQYDDAARNGIDCIQALKTQPLEEARAVCQELHDPSDPDKLVTLGMIYGKHEFHVEALEPFEQAARLDPESFETQHNLGLTYFRLKRYAEARRPLEMAVALRPDYFGSNALLGAALYTLKEDEAAYQVLGHAHQLNPQDPDTSSLLFKATMILAQESYAKKRYRECLDYLDQAVRLRPEDVTVRLRRTDVYALLGKPSQAEREKREAERLRAGR
ncbi:MAG: tetratricopeptide repeat protein [Acidobacteria bacterium]|nr:tetratricopeptide repeat protein [Acidobacteriota bacterium]MCI0724175.1 tetratricopeptide repeat protein [Acidobacteriota bacterium]